MCGRYSMRNPERALEEFSIVHRRIPLEPRYNVAPTQLAAIVRGTPEGRAADLVRWGLSSSGGRAPVIMVRLESLERGSFRSSFAGRRCIVLSDGFYEWRGTGKDRVPHHIAHADGSPLAIAGIWDARGDADAFAVVTRPANAALQSIHDRMPATIERADYDRWLDPRISAPDELVQLLGHDEPALVIRPVSKIVNSPRNDVPECLDSE